MNTQTPRPRLLLLAAGLITVLGLIVYISLSPESSSNTGQAGQAGESDSFSIFDMLDTGDLSDQEELNPEFARLLDMTNPRTGATYSEAEARKIQFLARKFPNNELIPRPLSEDEVREREQRMQQYEDQGFRITSGEASPEEIEAYYAFKTRFYTDKIELLQFGLGAEDLDEETYARMEKMLDAATRVVSRLSERKAASLEIQARRAAGEFEQAIPADAGDETANVSDS